MANVLKMSLIDSVLSLHSLGYSQRRIARELGIDRGTVGKYLRQRLCGARPAKALVGSKAKTKPGSKPKTALTPTPTA